MNFLLLGSVAGTLLGWLMGFLSLFLIMLILIQRGKGGGLTGALGGPGGQSAFGSKAGDTFTVITVVVASIWAFTCAFTMWLLGAHAPTTTITDTSIKPGPGDSREAEQSTIPPIGGSTSGLSPSGIGAAAGDAAAESLELTPAESLELTPAESNATETPGEENSDTTNETETGESATPE